MKRVLEILQEVFSAVIILAIVASPIIIMCILDRIDPILPNLAWVCIVAAFYTATAYHMIKSTAWIKSKALILLLSVLLIAALYAIIFLMIYFDSAREYFLNMTLTAKFLLLTVIALVIALIILSILKSKNNRLKEELHIESEKSSSVYCELTDTQAQLEKRNREFYLLNLEVEKLKRDIQRLRNLQSEPHVELPAEVIETLKQIAQYSSFRMLLKDTPLYRDLKRMDPEIQKKKLAAALTQDIPVLSVSGLEKLTATVQSSKDPNNPYTTSFFKCSCQDFNIYHRPCKHMFRMAIELGQLFVLTEEYAEEIKREIPTPRNRQRKKAKPLSDNK